MFLKRLKNETSGVAKTVIIIIIVIAVISASTLAVVLYQGSGSSSTQKAATGDKVSVNYIGYLPDGRVFGTNILSVATNTSIAKSFTFTLESNSTYVAYSFTIGGGTVITGFNDGIIGMTVGETKDIVIPSSKGYGASDSNNNYTFSITQTVSVFENMTVAQFKEKFNVTPVNGLSVTDPTYNWPVIVQYVNTDADIVRIQNAPTQGERIAIYQNTSADASGWNITIDSVDTTSNNGNGKIIFTNNITAADNGLIQGYDYVKKSTFILEDVNTLTGTAIRDYNSELLGKTLTFRVTLLSIS